MKVLVCPCDAGASGSYRLGWPSAACKDRPNVHIEVTEWQTADEPGPNPFPTAELVQRSRDFDVVVLQRPFEYALVDAVSQIRKQGTAVVVDVDDLFWLMPSNMGARRFVDPGRNKWHNYQNTLTIMRLADMVTAPSEVILGSVDHSRVRLLPNYVPSHYFKVQQTVAFTDGTAVGWTGNLSNHPGDLSVLRQTLPAVCKAVPDLEFSGVGSSAGLARLLGPEIPLRTTGQVPFASFPQAVKNAFEIGLAPLCDNIFNSAKSWLKPMEYAALGIPFVSSSRHYKQFAKIVDWEILYADSVAEWIERLSKLCLLNRAGRSQLGDDLRGCAQDRLDISRHAWRWEEAWADAVVNHRRRGAVVA